MEDPTQATIVMIEDNIMHGRMYIAQFNRSGFSNFFVYQGAEEGTQAIMEKKPDLVLLDIGLPDVDGLTILKNIKQDKEIAHIPVIMLSNMRKQDKGKEAKELGAIDYIVKAELLPKQVVDKVINFF